MAGTISLLMLLEAGGVQNITQPRGDTGHHSASGRDAVHASILWVGVAPSPTSQTRIHRGARGGGGPATAAANMMSVGVSEEHFK